MRTNSRWSTRVIAFLIGALCFLIPLEAHAKGGGGSRLNHRIGFTVGVGADPAPNMVGASLRFNLLDFFQLSIGYGTLSFTSVGGLPPTTTTISTSAFGAGARLFIPGWSFSPYAGFHYTKWSATGNVTLGGQTITAGAGLPAVMYATFGLDWQTYGGFNFGGGVHYLLAPTQLTTAITILPNVYLGWFF